MKTTVIVRLDEEFNPPSWVVSATNELGMVEKVTIIGNKPFDAAAVAAEMMGKYAMGKPQGGEVMAPEEVLNLIPEHLRKVTGKPKRERF